MRSQFDEWVRTNRRTGAFLAIVAAMALILATAVSVSGADESGLKLDVVATNKGPLGVGDNVAYFLYVTNKNQLTNDWAGTSRATLPNAFAVTSVDQTVYVDGVQESFATWTPPSDPDGPFITIFSGRWPSTVLCEEEEIEEETITTCDDILSPAVLPGETTAVLYPGWSHGSEELDGTYVFEFTVHGTLNEAPVDLTASSKAIEMTR